MNPIELAMQMEQDGADFYRDLADQATNPGFREIFNQLAEDEVKHYHLFKNIQMTQESFTESSILKNAGNIFKQMVAEDNLTDLDASQLHLYQKAMELEKQSQMLYLEKASETTDTGRRELLQKIAAEEEQHYLLLHNIYELVLRPQTWVENGEYVHLEEY